MLLAKICRALEDQGIPYALVGGHAVALHGAVRGTVDIDLVIEWERTNLERAVAVLATLGLRSSLPVTVAEIFANRDRYLLERNLIAWNFVNFDNPLEQVDLLIGFDLTGHAVNRIKTGFGEVRVLAKEELIRMKRQSGRPQDLEDIRALESL